MQQSESQDLQQQPAPAAEGQPASLLSRVKAALQTGDRGLAGELLMEADRRYPDDARFRPLHLQLSRLERRLHDFEAALGEATAELSNQLFAASLGRFREALNLGRGVPGLQERAFKTALEQAEELLERNWRIAESLLSEAAKLDSRLQVPPRLWNQIQLEQKEESINNALNEANRAETHTDLLHARDRLLSLLGRYPGEAKLAERLKFIEAELVRDLARDRETRLRTLSASLSQLDFSEDPSALRNFVRFRQPSLGGYRADPEFAAILNEADTLAARYDEAAAALADHRYQETAALCRTILSQRPGNWLFADLQEHAQASQLSLETSAAPSVVPAENQLAVTLESAPPPASAAEATPGPALRPGPVLHWSRRMRSLTVHANSRPVMAALAIALLAILVFAFLYTSVFHSSLKAPAVSFHNAETASSLTRSPSSPLSARLEIRDALPGTRISLDGSELATISAKEPLAVYVTPGSHTVEFSRKGFLRKQVSHDFGPGDRLLLAGSDAKLESDDARVAVMVVQRNTPPSTLRLPAGHQLPGALLANASQTVPDSPQQTAAQAQGTPAIGQPQDSLPKEAQVSEEQFEQREWNAVDKNSNQMLEAFLEKHPNGRYANAAQETIASLDRRAKADLIRLDEEAWSAVNPLDRGSIESYAARYPSGTHRSAAEEALANLAKADFLRQESAAVLSVLRHYVGAWNAKDTESILSLQRGLDRRVVKAQLSPLKSLTMSVSPTANPQIEGTQASVLCRSQVAEVFSDGVEKKTAETLVTFIFSKRNGVWTIDGTRQNTAAAKLASNVRQKM